jgi:HSP20 family protein
MSAAPRRGVLSAKLDVLEKPNEYLVNVELPGVKKDDIQVHVEKGMLSISAERRDEKKEDKDRYHYSERRYGSIKRVISLPEQADADKVNADFQDGILSLTFAKKPEAAHRKQITIG